MCNANYCFVLFDIGSYSSSNGSDVLANSDIGARLQSFNKLWDADLFSCDFEPLSFFHLGDETFPLTAWLLRPFPGRNLPEDKRVYIYRHCRVRRTKENTDSSMVYLLCFIRECRKIYFILYIT